jgi:hypothetical protein
VITAALLFVCCTIESPHQVKQVGAESLQVPVMAPSGKQKGFLQISLTYTGQVSLDAAAAAAAAAKCLVWSSVSGRPTLVRGGLKLPLLLLLLLLLFNALCGRCKCFVCMQHVSHVNACFSSLCAHRAPRLSSP